VPAGGTTGDIDLGPVTAGTHTLTVAGGVDGIFCDSLSWNGTLSVTTSGVSDDDVAFVSPGDQDTVSAPGILATLDRSQVPATAAVARLSVAKYDGLPAGAPSPPPIRTAGFFDLQLVNADERDVILGEFLPPNPVFPVEPELPPNPVVPPNPVLPPNPVRLAYWVNDAWAPVFSVFAPSGPPIVPAYDSVTHQISVTFAAASLPAVTELNGTVFALITSFYFRGFGAPVDAGALNVAKAGRAIPLKWQIFDATVEPVTDLPPSLVKIGSIAIPCTGTGQPSDEVEEYATGASGLQNLGQGKYQINWNTSKSYAGTCRRLRLDLGERNPDGTPFYRTADFQFTR
jgi:hypothetical protein